MKSFSEFMAEEYEGRLKQMDKEVESKKQKLGEIGSYVDAMKKKIITNKVYSVEKKVEGEKFFIHKQGSNLTVFDSSKKEIDFKFLENCESISDKNFIIESVLDDREVLYLTEILFFDKKDLTREPWHERKKILKRLNYSGKIKEVPTIIVKDKDSFEKSLNLVSKLKNSNGATIKHFESEYCPDSKNESFFEYVLSDEDGKKRKNTADSKSD